MRVLERIFVAMVAVLSASVLDAHEIGGLKVTALFSSDGRYQVDALFDLDTLPQGFFPHPEDAPRLLEENGHVLFDGNEVPLHPVAATSGDPRKILVRFLGSVPPGARTFSWSHGLAPGRYLMGTRHEEDSQIAWQWLMGTAASEPVPSCTRPLLPRGAR